MILKFTHKLPLQMTLGEGILGRKIPKKYHKTFNCHCNSGNFFVLQKGVKKSDAFISGNLHRIKKTFFSYFFTPSTVFKLEDYEENYTDSGVDCITLLKKNSENISTPLF